MKSGSGDRFLVGLKRPGPESRRWSIGNRWDFFRLGKDLFKDDGTCAPMPERLAKLDYAKILARCMIDEIYSTQGQP